MFAKRSRDDYQAGEVTIFERIAPTGRSIVLELSGVRAEIGTVAAVLRGLTVGGVAVTEPVPAEATPPLGAGIVLGPWPNRVRDAIHGLLRNTAYRPSVMSRR